MSRLLKFSPLPSGCSAPSNQRSTHNYICEAACPGWLRFPSCPAGSQSLLSRLPPFPAIARLCPLGSLLGPIERFWSRYGQEYFSSWAATGCCYGLSFFRCVGTFIEEVFSCRGRVVYTPQFMVKKSVYLGQSSEISFLFCVGCLFVVCLGVLFFACVMCRFLARVMCSF